MHPRRRSSATPPSNSRYAPLPRTSIDSQTFSASSSADEFKDKPLLRPRKRRLSRLARKSRRFLARFCRPIYILFLLSLFLGWQILFNGSYLSSSAPLYKVQMEKYKDERVFIAANIIDEDLIRGTWGRSLLQLVELIGKERVFVSVYGGPKSALVELEQMLECETSIVSEEDVPITLADLKRTKLPTGESRIKRIAFLAEVRNMVLKPLRDGSAWKQMSGKGIMDMVGLGKKGFEKVLFINDVFFDAEGATRLLWGTSIPSNEYKAVCAADFVTSWKYYDTFATRDAEGYSIGVPLFPWFSAEGNAISRNDVLAGKDAVRVKSCWGGMVAFDGRYFQAGNTLESESVSAGQHGEFQNSSKDNGKKTAGVGIPELPLIFRSEAEPFWDSSECCLIHADIMSLASFPSTSSSKVTKEEDPYDTGIYLNPFVRTAYSESAHLHIEIAKRFERLFSPIQRMLNFFAHMPRFNYRRAEKEGQILPDKLWISVHSNMTVEQSIALASSGQDPSTVDVADPQGNLEKRKTLGTVRGKEYWATQGYYVPFNRTGRRGGYCGVRQLLVLKEGAREGGNWDNLLDEVPPLDG